MKTNETQALSTLSADGKLHLHCPKSWAELSQQQLHYVLDLLGCGLYNDVEIRTYMLFRFCAIEVRKRRHTSVSCRVRLDTGKWHHFDIQNWQVQDMIGQLSFINSFEGFGRGLESVGDFTAADEQLSDYKFGWFLVCEKNYAAYINTKDAKYLDILAQWLYMYDDEPVAKSDKKLDTDAAIQMSVFLWFSDLKKRYARMYPNFYKPADKVGGSYNFLESYNAQLRALTDGDVTKEEEVKSVSCLRALTELDAKAREAEEFKRKYGDK